MRTHRATTDCFFFSAEKLLFIVRESEREGAKKGTREMKKKENHLLKAWGRPPQRNRYSFSPFEWFEHFANWEIFFLRFALKQIVFFFVSLFYFLFFSFCVFLLHWFVVLCVCCKSLRLISNSNFAYVYAHISFGRSFFFVQMSSTRNTHTTKTKKKKKTEIYIEQLSTKLFRNSFFSYCFRYNVVVSSSFIDKKEETNKTKSKWKYHF